MRCARQSGFTLTELLITVVVIGILAAVAVPSYSAYVARGQRSAAKVALQQAAQYLERNYTSFGCYDYDTNANACATTASLPNAYAPIGGGQVTYAVTVTYPATPTVGQSFRLAAAPCGTASGGCTAPGSNTSFTDTTCGALLLDNTGLQAIDKSGAGSWATPDTTAADVAACWQR
jgi:type IV pilus assembly protein PilE